MQQFAYVASHDLQSPLRSISGFVQLLKIGIRWTSWTTKPDDYIRRTVQAIAQMQTIIRDLLSYSRVDSRSRPFAAVSLSLMSSMIRWRCLESSIRDAGGQVTCGELPVVMGDRSQLVQLMQNLIGNGLKYHGDRSAACPCLRRTWLKGNEWIVSVRDNGIGIDPKYYERIFEIFKRLHDQTGVSGHRHRIGRLPPGSGSPWRQRFGWSPSRDAEAIFVSPFLRAWQEYGQNGDDGGNK